MMQSALKFFGFIAAVLIMVSCGGGSEFDPPEGILSKQDMILVTTDMQLLTAVHQRRMFRMKNFNEYDLQSYQTLFAKHGITAEDYQRSLSYYKDFPDELIKVQDEVLAELSRRQALLDQVEVD